MANDNDIQNAKIYFFGHKYIVRVANEGTEREQLIICKFTDMEDNWDKPWTKPLIIGGGA